jgi:hypothetical protein
MFPGHHCQNHDDGQNSCVAWCPIGQFVEAMRQQGRGKIALLFVGDCQSAFYGGAQQIDIVILGRPLFGATTTPRNKSGYGKPS